MTFSIVEDEVGTGMTYVRKVNDRITACSSEDVEESKRDDIDRVILTVGS